LAGSFWFGAGRRHYGNLEIQLSHRSPEASECSRKSTRPSRCFSSLSLRSLAHDVVNHRIEFGCWREVDIFGVLQYLWSMPRRPIKCLTFFIILMTCLGVHAHLTLEDISPVGALTKIIGKPFQSGPQIGALLRSHECNRHRSGTLPTKFDAAAIDRNWHVFSPESHHLICSPLTVVCPKL